MILVLASPFVLQIRGEPYLSALLRVGVEGHEKSITGED